MKFLLAFFFCLYCFAAAGDPDANEDALKDLQAFQQQSEKVLKQLEQAPVLPGAQGQVEQLQRKALKLATDDRFLKAAGDLWNNPDRNKMLVVQGVFFLLMILLKAWRQSKATNWFWRLIVGLCFTLLTWAGISYLIPLVMLGQPFAVFTSTLWHVMVSG